MKFDERPLFYDVYEAFPPMKEPVYHTKVDPSWKIRQIFYAEDMERA